MAKRLIPGDVFAIPDIDGGFYFGVIAAGDDVLFKNVYAQQELSSEDAAALETLVRLPVFAKSIKDAGWRRLGSVAPQGEITQFGRYRNQPVGSRQIYIYDNSDASLHAVAEEETEGLQDLAVWDAQAHVLPLLRDLVRGISTANSRANIRFPLKRA